MFLRLGGQLQLCLDGTENTLLNQPKVKSMSAAVPSTNNAICVGRIVMYIILKVLKMKTGYLLLREDCSDQTLSVL